MGSPSLITIRDLSSVACLASHHVSPFPYHLVVMSRKPSKPTVSGILPISLSATKKEASTTKNADRASKKHNSGRGSRKSGGPPPPLPKLKLVIRRLPPGLTQDEFEKAIGDEWLIGRGKVDWTRYIPGKATKGFVHPRFHRISLFLA